MEKKQHRSKTTILIVEDEEAIRAMLRFSLQSEPFSVMEAATIKDAKHCLADQRPDLILLDWMLPGQSGIHFLQWLKQMALYREIPLIMLTAKAEEENRVRGLGAGADDYIVKPFSPRELIARIKAVLRRGVLFTPEGTLSIDALTLNLDQKSLTIRETPISLTKNEYQLLHFFMTHADRIYSRGQLIESVWGNTCYIDERSVDAQVKRLRHKLQTYDCDQYIITIRGVGYQFLSKKGERV